MNDERILEVIEKNDKYYILGFINGIKADRDILKQENAELKKQLDKANDELHTLKNKYNIRLLNQISEGIEPDCEDYYLAEMETYANKYDSIQTQQQEFIKYLEDNWKQTQDIWYVKILNKYNEIIGVSDEKDNN